MVIDVTHLSDAALQDVVNATHVPLIASHSNCRSIHNTRRNLTDEQIAAIAATGGVIGVNGVSAIVSDNANLANITRLVDHVDQLRQVAGIDHISLGLDLFAYHFGIPAPDSAQLPPDVICWYGQLGDLTTMLASRGYSHTEIMKIMGGNFMRVLAIVLGGND
jgi:membrane dipeptidase